jgi:hypothetical protein
MSDFATGYNACNRAHDIHGKLNQDWDGISLGLRCGDKRYKPPPPHATEAFMEGWNCAVSLYGYQATAQP